eukprot:GEMP01065035.1.p1 GENE.GEMP01065035.1~~GEMP01065035.1.p1  ORF type:complete len:189 (-),score=42.35 GEMP01065035.1:585-1151(-)
MEPLLGFQKGDYVLYCSQRTGKWKRGKVKRLRNDGKMDLDIKTGAMLDRCQMKRVPKVDSEDKATNIIVSAAAYVWDHFAGSPWCTCSCSKMDAEQSQQELVDDLECMEEQHTAEAHGTARDCAGCLVPSAHTNAGADASGRSERALIEGCEANAQSSSNGIEEGKRPEASGIFPGPPRIGRTGECQH